MYPMSVLTFSDVLKKDRLGRLFFVAVPFRCRIQLRGLLFVAVPLSLQNSALQAFIRCDFFFVAGSF
jgi:hypothetical protein